MTCEQRKGGLCFPSAGAFCDFLAAKKLECKDYKKNKRQQLKVEKSGGIQANDCSDAVVAMPFLYCTIKLLDCIWSQVVFFSYFAFGPFGRRPLVLCR